jgi:bile acid:Na+ symporter, BASS family
MISQTILIAGIYLFIITSMLFIGLGHTYRDIIAPFRNIRLVLLALLVNLVLIPLTGYLIATVFALSGALLVGFLLMTSAPGASYGPRLAEICGGDIPFSTGLMFLLCTVALVSTPITLVLLLPEGTVVSVWPVIQTILLLMVVPMVIGLLTRAKRPALAEKMMKPVVLTSYLMILVVLVMALGVKLFAPNPVGGLIDLFGTFGIFAIALAVGISLILGYMSGGSMEGIRRSLATGSAIRNAGMALLFAASIFAAVGDVLTVLVAYIIIQTLLVGLVAGMWRKQGSPGTG